MDERLGTPNNEGRLMQSNEILRAALLGVRGLAEVEASRSKAWRDAVEQIDRCLKEAALPR